VRNIIAHYGALCRPSVKRACAGAEEPNAGAVAGAAVQVPVLAVPQL